MSYYIRYVLMDDASVTLPDLELALKALDSGYEIDGDIIVLNDEDYGQIEINERNDPLFVDDLELLRRFAETKSNKNVLLADLNRGSSLVIVQPIWSRQSDEGVFKVMEPLFGWLLSNRKGLLAVEGGSFYNTDGPII